MTDAPRSGGPRRVARVPAASTTAAGASALFLGALGVIGVQMAQGRDPALGTAPAPGVRHVVERRVVRHVVVTDVVTDAAQAPAPPTGVSSAPVVRTSAPPVPAPAPAPLRTATS